MNKENKTKTNIQRENKSDCQLPEWKGWRVDERGEGS